MRRILPFLLVLIPLTASAAKSVMEGIVTTNQTVLVDTTNTRVDIATSSYNGKVSSVGLYSSSNVVISSTNGDNCVVYATGSISCLGANLTSGSGGSFVLRTGDTMTGQLTMSGTTLSITNNSTFTASGWADGFEHVIGTATVSAQSSYLFNSGDLIPGSGVISSSYSYRLCGWGVGNTSSLLWQLRFNGDSGANYQYHGQGNNSGAGSLNPAGEGATQAIIGDSVANDVGDPVDFCVTFHSITASSNIVIFRHQTEQNIGTANRMGGVSGGGQYAGSSPLSSVTFMTSAGSFTGQLMLWQTQKAFP